MLQIKLPKGKTSKALHLSAKWHGQKADVAREAYRAQLETWRKTIRLMDSVHVSDWPPMVSGEAEYHLGKAVHLLGLAEACTHSTGDVYVDVTMWNEIKGYYDV